MALDPALAVVAAHPSQQRAWFEMHRSDASSAYQFQVAIEVSGEFDPDGWRRACGAVVERHDVFRTAFRVTSGGLVCEPLDPWTPEIETVDLRAVPSRAQGAALERLLAAHEVEPWDCGAGPLIRWRLFRLADRRWVVSHVEHHLVHDGWSFGLVLNDACAIYRDPRAQLRPAASFRRYAQEFAERLPALRADDGPFWEEYLSGAPARPASPVPVDHLGPADSGCLRQALTPELRRAVEAYAARHRVTPFAALLSAMGRAMRQVSDEDDVVIGSAVGGRGPDARGVVGMLVNTCPLRLPASATRGWSAQHVREAQEAVLSALEHHELPLDEIVRMWRRDAGSSALPFASMFSLHHAPIAPLDLGAGAAARLDYRMNATGKMPLEALVIQQQPGVDAWPGEPVGYDVVWQHARGAISTELARAIAAIYADALARLLGDDDAPRSRPASPASIAAGAPAPQRTLPDILGAIVGNEAQSRAVAAGGQDAWSHRDLAREIHAVCAELAASGLVQDELVSVETGRDGRYLAAALATLAAGGVVLPAAPDDEIGRAYGRPRMRVDRDGRVDAGARDPLVVAAAAACVPVAHGPDGAAASAPVTRAGLAASVDAVTHLAGLRDSDVAVVLSAPSSGALLVETIAVLAAGGCVVLRDPLADPDVVAELCARDAATVVCGPTRTLEDLVASWNDAPPHASLEGVRTAIAAGEADGSRLSDAWTGAARGASLVTTYGLAETGCVATACRADGAPREAGASPIGRPVSGMWAAVLDAHGAAAPHGAIGELVLGGACVPPAAAERSTQTPPAVRTLLGGRADADRCHATGERARMRADGSVELVVPRTDDAAVATALEAHPAVRHAALVDRVTDAGPALVAFVVPSRPSAHVDGDELLRHLRSLLPARALPSQVVATPRLPLAAHGRLARAQLRTLPLVTDQRGGGGAGPQGELERTLAQVWVSVLDVPSVRRSDNFFDLGGHSMAAIDAVAQISGRLGIELPLGDFLGADTLAELATAIASHAHPSSPAS